jgi:hypothetical protein
MTLIISYQTKNPAKKRRTISQRNEITVAPPAKAKNQIHVREKSATICCAKSCPWRMEFTASSVMERLLSEEVAPF